MIIINKTTHLLAGNLGSLASRDGDALRVLRFVTPNQASVAHVELIATLPKDPWYLWLRVTSRVSMSLGQTLRVERFDRARQVWDTQFAYQRDMKESWTYGECIAHRRALDFCDGSRTVRAR
ncbi:MAG: hypothetical protein JNM34_11605, partial [Chthonomonadaceae bacterium]|nr:hypothetical protein [Chthonomonadaceae bacterium]